ncbi:MAG: CBS domain-containing protein [Actinobacteria bacterium]|nr:CBS domain-containing protein [Actinomycetota bacterium]
MAQKVACGCREPFALLVLDVRSDGVVVRLLHERGASLAGTVVSDIMNIDVVTCLPADEVDDILRIMTDRRIRHLPVMVDGKLSGIVSMGDLVKARIDELETDRAFLQSYIGAG